MSNQFIQIPSLLSKEELSQIEDLIRKANFVDGKLTASFAAREVKNNQQIDANDNLINEINNLLASIIQNNQLFNTIAMPKTIHPFLVSKYGPGQYYGWHVDSPAMGNPVVRTDLAMTIFLSDPDNYEGGELVLQTGAGVVSLKPPKGDAIVYPCQYLHGVNAVQRGERLAAVTWIQSIVRSPDQRQLLLQLSQVHSMIAQKDKQSAEAQLLLQTYSNLWRMWADI
jgi:PKHD-type hydroxylase